jgi:hypothetical protein
LEACCYLTSPLLFGEGVLSGEDWKTAQRDYVLCAVSKADELLDTDGSSSEVAEISTTFCSPLLNTYKKRFSEYLLLKMTGSSGKEMADAGAEKSGVEVMTRTKAVVAERILKQRARARSIR